MVRTGDLDSMMLDAALGKISFANLLTTLIDQFDGAGGVIFELNRRTGEINNWIGPGLEAGASDYIEHLNTINPRMRYSLRHAPGHVVYEGLFTNDAAMNRCEFYDAIRRLTGVRYFLGSRLYDDGDISVFHSIEFDDRHGHPEPSKIDLFTHSSANLGKAWKLLKTQQPDMAVEQERNFIFEHLPWAVFSIDRQTGISAMNSSAEAFLVHNGAVTLHEGCLISQAPGVNDALAAILKDALAGKANSIALPLTGPHEFQIIQTLPAPGGKRAYLFVRNPQHSSQYLEKLAPELFGLTKMESRVLAVFSRSSGLQNIADELQLSPNTVRNHLNRIYRKTGTQNRAELLFRVLGLVE